MTLTKIMPKNKYIEDLSTQKRHKISLNFD
jgi:hypothetical protein